MKLISCDSYTKHSKEVDLSPEMTKSFRDEDEFLDEKNYAVKIELKCVTTILIIKGNSDELKITSTSAFKSVQFGSFYFFIIYVMNIHSHFQHSLLLESIY